MLIFNLNHLLIRLLISLRDFLRNHLSISAMDYLGFGEGAALISLFAALTRVARVIRRRRSSHIVSVRVLDEYLASGFKSRGTSAFFYSTRLRRPQLLAFRCF